MHYKNENTNNNNINAHDDVDDNDTNNNTIVICNICGACNHMHKMIAILNQKVMKHIIIQNLNALLHFKMHINLQKWWRMSNYICKKAHIINKGQIAIASKTLNCGTSNCVTNQNIIKKPWKCVF